MAGPKKLSAPKIGKRSESKKPAAKKPRQPKKQAEDKIRKVALEKPGNLLYPVPAVMVSCVGEGHRPNIITVAWAGTICSEPPMVSISVRRERHSYELIKSSGEFVINLVNKSLVRAADLCGVKSGREIDKLEECHLTAAGLAPLSAPQILESPVSIACKVTGISPLGSHDMFIAEVVGIQVDARYLDRKGALHLERAGLVAYSHGRYYELGKLLGSFGYSVRKKR